MAIGYKRSDSLELFAHGKVTVTTNSSGHTA